MSTFADAIRIVNREFEFFAYGEGHMLDVIRRCPSDQRWELFDRLSHNVLTCLRREMPRVSDRVRAIYRNVVMDPVREKIDRIF
jgi:hypothetical protein